MILAAISWQIFYFAVVAALVVGAVVVGALVCVGVKRSGTGE